MERCGRTGTGGLLRHVSEDEPRATLCPAFSLHVSCLPVFGHLGLSTEYLLEPIVPCAVRCLQLEDLPETSQKQLSLKGST